MPFLQYGRKIDWLLFAACIVIVTLLVFAGIRQDINPVQALVSAFNAQELALLDKRLQIRAKTLIPSPDIVVLAVDRETEAYARRHPDFGVTGSMLRRDRLAQIIRYLKQQGARAIVLDIELTQPTEYDDTLGQAIAEAGNVYAAFSMDTPLEERMANFQLVGLPADTTREEARWHLENYCLNYAYEEEYRHHPAYLKSMLNSKVPVDASGISDADFLSRTAFCYSAPIVPEVASSLRALGTSSVVYDADAMVRQMSVLRRGYRGNYYTYIGIKPVLDMLGVDKVVYTADAFTLVKQGDVIKTIPLTDGWRMMINWRHPANLVRVIQEKAGLGQDLTAKVKLGANNVVLGNGMLYRHVSAADVLKAVDLGGEPPDDPALLKTLYVIPGQKQTGAFSFKDKIVVYGDTIRDVHETPVGKITYGPEILATVLDSVLNDEVFVKKAGLPMTVIITAVLFLLIVLCMLRTEKFVLAFTESVLLIVFYWVVSFMAFYANALWMPIVFPTLFLLLAVAGSMLYRYYVHDREKRYLTNAFSRYVSPQLMAQILRDPMRALENLRGEKKAMTVMFTDIRGFTRRLEQGVPDVIMGQLNRYFDAMIQVTLSYEGTYDKFLGDGLLVFFGAPVDMPNHAENACKAALAMQKALGKLNEEFIAEGLEPFEHSIGIATGEMIVGNFGSSLIKNFTVMGSIVNLAARLEGYTRRTDEHILISEETCRHVSNWQNVHDLGRVEIRGFSEPVQVYALRL